MCYFSVLDNVRQHIQRKGEDAQDPLDTKIKELDSEIAELDKVKQKTRTYK